MHTSLNLRRNKRVREDEVREWKSWDVSVLECSRQSLKEQRGLIDLSLTRILTGEAIKPVYKVLISWTFLKQQNEAKIAVGIHWEASSSI